MQKPSGKQYTECEEEEEQALAKKIQKGKARKKMRKRIKHAVPNIHTAPSRNQLTRPE